MDFRRGESLRQLLPAGTHLTAVGIDGPLATGLQLIREYRTADALLSRGLFQSRCKPGSSISRTGQALHHTANDAVGLVMRLKTAGHIDLARADHPDRLCDSGIREVFPTAFLAVLLNDVDIDNNREGYGRKKSDGYWEMAVREGSLCCLVESLDPHRRLDQSLDSIKDHDHRAAFVCALAALCLARNRYVSVGDDQDGNIVLPPLDHWWFDTASPAKMGRGSVEAQRGFSASQSWFVCQP